jgi:hypothetical protein
MLLSRQLCTAIISNLKISAFSKTLTNDEIPLKTVKVKYSNPITGLLQALWVPGG